MSAYKIITSTRYLNHFLRSSQGFCSRSGCVPFSISHVRTDQNIGYRRLSVDVTKKANQRDENFKSSETKLIKSNQQEIEEELMTMNSAVKQHFQHANYTEALKVSNEVLEKSLKIFGTNHPAVASAYNNIGLMNKMIGEFQEARINYHKALSIYQDIVGKDHASYAAALSNLGNLDRAQSMTDESLSHFQRLQLNESAIEYFEESWNVRKAELGLQHPQTVISQSNLGGAIAAQVLQGEFFRQNMNKEQGHNISGHKNSSSKITQEKWDLAEQHLRLALQTAIKNPSGQQVQIAVDEKYALPPRRDSNLKSKKEKRYALKLRKRFEKQITQDEKDSGSNSENNNYIRTLTAAAAAQNLAVFLKTRADIVSKSTKLFNASTSLDQTLSCGDMYAEAKSLYTGALNVRTKLRGEHHPDTISTKFSLAELVDAIGDESGANKLRQELLDSYQVEERDEGDTIASQKP